MYDAALLFYDSNVFVALRQFLGDVERYGGLFQFAERARSRHPYALRHNRAKADLLRLEWLNQEYCEFLLYLPRVDDGGTQFDDLRATWEGIKETFCVFEEREIDLAGKLSLFRTETAECLARARGPLGGNAAFQRRYGRVLGAGDDAIELAPARDWSHHAQHESLGPQLDWQSTTHWRAPNVDGQMVSYPIREMHSGHLVDTLDWLVANKERLFKQLHVDYRHLDRLETVEWLISRPAFRALVEEAVRRDLRLPHEAFRFIRDWVLIEGHMVVPSWEADELQRDTFREARRSLAEASHGELRQIDFLEQDDQTGESV